MRYHRRLREIKAQVETHEQSIVALEAQTDPELDINQADISQATEAIRGMVLDADDPVTVRTFFGTFVEKITIEAERVTIEFDPAKIMNHGISVVHNKSVWLPDLDSNQGPAD